MLPAGDSIVTKRTRAGNKRVRDYEVPYNRHRNTLKPPGATVYHHTALCRYPSTLGPAAVLRHSQILQGPEAFEDVPMQLGQLVGMQVPCFVFRATKRVEYGR